MANHTFERSVNRRGVRPGTHGDGASNRTVSIVAGRSISR
jgi:hypothetical protein